VVGKARLADVGKARPGIEALLEYMVTLHDDIMERFPAGKLPEASLVTQRFTQEEVDELIQGPLNGGKHLYTIAWPPI
jgi:creatinine amidohydrolase